MKSVLMAGFFILSLPAWAKVEVSYENLKGLLDQKNAAIASAKLRAEAAKDREGFFARSFMPKLELYGLQESFKTGSSDTIHQPGYGAEASINLFNGGRDWNEAKIRNRRSEQMQVYAQRVQIEELEKLRILFWESLYLRDKVEVLKSAIDLNNRNAKSAARRLNSGVGTESDRLEFEMEAISLKQELEEAQLNYSLQLKKILVVLNLDEHEEILLTDSLTHEHEYHDLTKHTEKDHELLYKENEIAAEITGLEAKNKSYGWIPSVDAFASYNQYNQREIDMADEKERRESVVGLKASLSFGTLLESNSEASALKKEARSLGLTAEQQKKELHTHVEGELEELDLLHSQIHIAESNIKLAEKYYKVTDSEYSRGVKNSPDVLGASTKLLEVKDKHLKIVRDFQIARAHILSKIGK